MNPQYPQHMQQQQPQGPSPEEKFTEQLVRALVVLIAQTIEPELLDEISKLGPQDARLAEHLRRHLDQLEIKIRNRSRSKAAPAPQEPRPRMGNGKVDHQLEATRAVYQLFNNALQSRGGK
jgi:hypothetical protein